MHTWVITLADELGEIPDSPVEHEGYLEVRPSGAITISRDIFESPYIGYAEGTWTKFEKKEAQS